MSGQKDVLEFPDLSNKLTAPSKKSLFERQKAEAEAKRQREEAETAAVYNEFVKSFDDDDGNTSISSERIGGKPATAPAFSGSGPRGPPPGPSRRHFVPTGRSSGPGTLDPPTNLSRKRYLDGSNPSERPRDRGLFAFDDSEATDAVTAFRNSEEEDFKEKNGEESERAAPKPTLQLSSLPPGTSPAVIKSMIPPLLKIEGVRINPPAGPGSSGSTERKSMSAIVTLAQDTPATDIETVVNSLQNRYLGWGFYLSLSRHLSSAALGSMGTAVPAMYSGSSSLPFNAKPISQGPSSALNRAPPPEIHRGGIAPPSSYGPSVQSNRAGPAVQVRVNPPGDIRELKLIHKTVESLLTHGPEFEALLMSRPEVQKEEKWAWIWNPRSPGGIWYRWRLWEVLTGAGTSKSKAVRQRLGDNTHKLFEGGVAWSEPEDKLPFEFTTQFSGLISDSDYDSSDEDDSGDENGPHKRRRQFYGGGGPPPEGILNTPAEEQAYLNPLQKAKLTHLLARLPTTAGKLRKGDVARVTAFAISHASRGADEVVDMLVTNVLRPYCWSKSANPDMNDDGDEDDQNDDILEGKDDGTGIERKEKEDVSPATLIALHLISDILSASSTSGVRHAWRYRSLFEHSLASRKIFAYLGRMEKTLGWGRLRAEKWRRSINTIFQLWEGWCVFPAATQERFVEEFVKPPLTNEEAELERAEKEKKMKTEAAKSKWRAVEARKSTEDMVGEKNDTKPLQLDGQHLDTAIDDVDGEPMEDVDGEPMDDIDGEPSDEDVDGEPMDEDEDIDGEPMEEEGTEDDQAEFDKKKNATPTETAAARGRAARVKAEDMFADSDED